MSSNDNIDPDQLALSIFERMKELCGGCRAALGWSTTGPATRPVPSSCWACSVTKRIHAAHRS